MKASKEIQQKILAVVNAQNYKPLKATAIAKKLRFKDDDSLKELKRAVKVLVNDGQIVYGSRHLILPGRVRKPRKAKEQDPGDRQYRGASGKVSTKQSRGQNSSPGQSSGKPKANEVIGIYRRNPSGFGFVTPRGSTVTDRSEDIYIAKNKTADAADGDQVRIRTSTRKTGRETRTSGTVIDVLDRKTNRFVGTYRERGRIGVVTIDSGVFDAAILVGDASSRNCRVGDKVVVEMARFPSERQEGEGVIVEVLGDRGEPGVDTKMIIHEYGLPGEFSEKVLESARQQAEKFKGEIANGRVDFTGTTVITIDPKTARDFDDAISLEKLKNGHWKLGVHIADVSHFVPFRSDVDAEAFKRSTSVYLPDRVIPMIPELISNNLASLQPDRVRYTMTAMIEFTSDGAPVATDLYRGAINSAHRFSYEEVDEYLENDKPWKKRLTPGVFKLVRNMHTLAMELRRRRKARGSIDLALPEVRIDLDEDGRVCGAHAEEHTESHQVIEEFMIAANEAVAGKLADEGLFLMRRIHEAPSEAKSKDLTRFIQQVGIECGSLKDRFELKRVVDESMGMKQQHAIHFAILRSMQKAIYSPIETGHYALASEAYCHFTSPIRRYPDLIIHRVVGDLIDGKKPFSDFDKLASLGKHCSDLERRAEQAERELIKLKLLNFLEDKVGMEMKAVVTGVEQFGIFAQGVELPAEGLIPVANLPEDRYQFDKASRTLNGHREGNQFQLGDVVTIVVAKVDPDERLLEFGLAGATIRSEGERATDRGRVRGGDQGQKRERNSGGPSSGRSDGASGKKPNSSRKRRQKKEWAPKSGSTAVDRKLKREKEKKKKKFSETKKKTPKKKPGSSRSSRKKAAAQKSNKSKSAGSKKPKPESKYR